ncbi:MAG: FxsA family protein [Beijerinckiaceae bacterium]
MRVLNGKIVILGGATGKTIVAIWVIAEVFAYALVLSHVSLLSALAIGVGSTALGLVALRVIGRQFLRKSGADLQEFATLADLRAIPLALIGAILLLLPGFLSDLLGLVLALLGYRAFLRRAEGPGAAREFDLERGEWTRLPDDESRR